MSPRPALPVGTYGTIWTSNNGAPYKARVRYRDRDGTVRTVARFGQTKTAARNSLRAALAERTDQSGTLDRSKAVSDLAALWLAGIEARPNLATQTKALYRYAIDRYVKPNVGALRIGEASTAVLDRALKDVAKKNGPAAAKTARAVLNGMFGLAVRQGALTVNPVRETEPVPRKRRTPVRALTVAEVDDLTDKLRAHGRAVDLDLPDLVEFMLGTAVRIGEALAAHSATFDLDAGVWDVNATIIRIKGEGLVIQEYAKTGAGARGLALPPHIVAMVGQRQAVERLRPRTVRFLTVDDKLVDRPARVLFPSPGAKRLRDPSNTPGDLRKILDELGYPWITSHSFRKTALTRLLEAGMPPNQVAVIAGHSHPSMTLDRYSGRTVVSADMARILDR